MKTLYFAIVIAVVATSCQPREKQPESSSEGANAVVENIMSRRSIRSYKPEQVSDRELDIIMECAINAPSALNRQTWEIRVIQDTDLIKELNAGFVQFSKDRNMQGSASRSQEPGFSVFHGAPTVIIVAADESAYSPVDCGLLGQNILLAAESMNIGTCVVGGIIGYLQTDEAKNSVIPKLKLSEGFTPLYSITMGYKNEAPAAKPRDKSKVQYIR
jgi:nitroreductase